MISRAYNLTEAQGWAFGFLHELSHATGKFVHPENTPPSGNTQVVTDEQLNQLIYDACFKPEG
jgi:hypothetical protein